MKRRSSLHALLGSLGAAVTSRAIHARDRRVLLQKSPVAGFEYHRGEAIWPALHVGDELSLVREAANAYDRDAVAVYIGDDQLGYVPQLENRAIAQMLDRGERLEGKITRLRAEGHPWHRVRMSISLAS